MRKLVSLFLAICMIVLLSSCYEDPLTEFIEDKHHLSEIEESVISTVIYSEIVSCEDLSDDLEGLTYFTPKEDVQYIDCFEESSYCGMYVSEGRTPGIYNLLVYLENNSGNRAFLGYLVDMNTDTWSLRNIQMISSDGELNFASIDPEAYGVDDIITRSGFSDEYRYVVLNAFHMYILYDAAPKLFN